ncbi:MAG TPA: RNA polymerase sigma factor [Gemmatimonadaceae bacterium]|nr:RNA polymerase sigma factor [Gemmatimonadaceae bacterium]
MTNARTDEELLAASAEGDGAAFAVLVRRYVRSATLLAAQLVGDADEAEDVVQDAFTVIHREATRFERGRPFAPWCFAIVRRLAANRRAREARRARLRRLWHSGPATAPSHEDATLARVDAAAVWRAMADLPAMQRACFELVVVRGLPIDEVAAMHGITASTVRQHVFRARAVLRDRMIKTDGA